MHGTEAIVFRLEKENETSLELFACDREDGEEVSVGEQRRTRRLGQVRRVLGETRRS